MSWLCFVGIVVIEGEIEVYLRLIAILCAQEWIQLSRRYRRRRGLSRIEYPGRKCESRSWEHTI